VNPDPGLTRECENRRLRIESRKILRDQTNPGPTSFSCAWGGCPGLRPGIFSAVPFDKLTAGSGGTVPGFHVYPGLTSWATLGRPVRQAQGRLFGTGLNALMPRRTALPRRAPRQAGAGEIVGIDTPACRVGLTFGGRSDRHVLMREGFGRGAVSPVVDCVADGSGGQVATAHLVFGNTAQGFGYRLLGDGVGLFYSLA
jgi:hypothetical protein